MRWLPRWLPEGRRLIPALGLPSALVAVSVAAAAAPGDPNRGAVWAELGSCGACHTAEEGAPYAGGHAIETDRGTFYGPNITPDPTHGIGEWTYNDFVRAMRHGRSPAGHTYWPAFPYPAYTHLRDAELADLWAYLRTLSPSDRPDQRHAVRIPRWPAAGIWRRQYFEPGPFVDDPTRSTEWNRGAYLGTGIGHCGECHTPRNRLGALSTDEVHWGAPGPPESAPDITPGAHGLAAWDLDDVASFLEDGMTAEGDVVGGEMARIVEHGTAKLSAADRRALAMWLLSLPASPGVVEESDDEEEYEDEDWE